MDGYQITAADPRAEVWVGYSLPIPDKGVEGGFWRYHVSPEETEPVKFFDSLYDLMIGTWGLVTDWSQEREVVKKLIGDSIVYSHATLTGRGADVSRILSQLVA